MSTSQKHDINDLASLERALESIFIPVAPRPDFVQRLEQQLLSAPISQPDPLAERIRTNPGQATLIGLAGIFSILMLIAAGFRTAAALLGVVGLVNEFNNRVRNEEAPPTAPAT